MTKAIRTRINRRIPQKVKNVDHDFRIYKISRRSLVGSVLAY